MLQSLVDWIADNWLQPYRSSESFYLVKAGILVGLFLVATLSILRNHSKLREKTGWLPGIYQLLPEYSYVNILHIAPRWLFPYQGNEFPLKFKWNELYEKVGSDVISFTSLTDASVMVADPEAAKKVTSNRAQFPKQTGVYDILKLFGENVLTTTGNRWKTHRQITSPTFSESLLRLVHEQTIFHTQNMTRYWFDVLGSKDGQDKHADGVAVRIDKDLIKLALFIFAGAGFGVTLPHWDEQKNLLQQQHSKSHLSSSKSDRLDEDSGYDSTSPAAPVSPGVFGEHSMTLHESLDGISRGVLLRLLFPKWAFKLSPSKYLRHIDECFEEFDVYMQELVHNVQSGANAGGKDLLSSLVAASGFLNSADDSAEKLKPKLSESELYGNMFIYLLAGHETTAHTLIYAMIYLSLYPDIQEKLHQEVKQIMDENGDKVPSYDDYSKYIYSQCIMNETLRLFPPVAVVPKITAEDVEIHGGHWVKKGTPVHLHVAALHVNENVWGKDAKEFRPERFDPRSPTYHRYEHAIKHGGFMPFSDGARSCIGKRFAQIEGVCVLSYLARWFKFELDPASTTTRDNILDSYAVLTTTPKNPISLLVKKRYPQEA